MLTIKWRNENGVEFVDEAFDVRASLHDDGRFCKAVTWRTPGKDGFTKLAMGTTAYVMNDTGATIAKYVILPEYTASHAPE